MCDLINLDIRNSYSIITIVKLIKKYIILQSSFMFFPTRPHPRAITDHLSVIIHCFAFSREFYINWIISCILFLVWSLSLSIIFLRFIYVVSINSRLGVLALLQLLKELENCLEKTDSLSLPHPDVRVTVAWQCSCGLE